MFRYWVFDIVSWLIEPEPPSWDMVSWLMAPESPIVSCAIAELLDVPEWPMLSWPVLPLPVLSWDVLLGDIVSCDVLDELWAKAGTANTAATRAAAAKVEMRLDIDDSFKGC
jgi:hypothetical protein